MAPSSPAGSLTSLTAALTTLFLPPEPIGQEKWGRSVARTVGDAVCATHAVLIVGSRNEMHAYGDDLRENVRTLHSTLHGALLRGEAPATRPAPGAWCRRAEGEGAGRTFDSTAIAGAVYDAVGLTTRVGLPGVRASVVCFHETPPTEAELRRHVDTLALLCPAVAAGVRSRAEAARERHTLTRLLDAMGQGIALFDAQGTLLHENPALLRLLERDPERVRLLRASASAARAVIARSRPRRFASSDEMPCPELRQLVRTGSALYSVYARLVAPDAPPAGGTVAVTVEPATAGALSVAPLRKRFGLTDRELDVTNLLSAGKSNADIARALGISPFTARHHTESVLAKLGVRSRAEVPRLVLVADAAALLGAAAD